ncbi:MULTISPECIES: flagellar motor protein MotB [unclassified Endozoicomonas]|uniref:flagellar motor protein MotB n=1 Tax=unclassified Endozoicomonas TaxID=2644528 RepID=UPI0021476E72|nr:MULTISPECIES: flagellar motor protein MotB [unclassified Endozoicomonas]
MSKGHVIVIKKKHGGHGDGHHGGSWKVAFADFAIAMMALFLLLWIMSATDKEQKKAIATYFEDPGSFRHPSSSKPINFGVANTVVDIPKPGPGKQGREDTEVIADQNTKTLNNTLIFDKLSDELQKLIGGSKSAGRYEDYIYLEETPEGLRIVILDNNKRDMFEKGRARLQPFFQDLLLELAPILNKLSFNLMISGHTDSSGFQRNDYSNWELSSARAQIARRTLVFGGLEESRIMMVLGMADRVLRNPENPEASSNRRIEILLLAKDMEERIEKMFAPIEEGTQKLSEGDSRKMRKALEKAKSNQLPEEMKDNIEWGN